MMKKLCEKIEAVSNIEDYRNEVGLCISELERAGYVQIAHNIHQLSDIPYNKFSKQATDDAFIRSKEAVIQCLKSYCDTKRNFSSEEAVRIVSVIIREFAVYFDLLFNKKPHGKCTNDIKKLFSTVHIANEYDLQHFLYPIVRMMFPNARVEEYQDTGHHAVRKDIVIDEYDIAIELKCTNGAMKEADLSDEIAADMIHYNNSSIFFYIYDKNKIISNPNAFKLAYQKNSVEGKKIFVEVVQPIVV